MAPTAPGKSDQVDESYSGEDRLDVLFKLQKDLLKRTQQALKKVPDIKKKKTSREFYTQKLQAIGQIVDDFETNHREIVALIPSADQDAYKYFADDAPMQFEEVQTDYVIALQNDCEEKHPQTERPIAGDKSSQLASHVSLPTVSIPHFSGAHTEWKTFYDLFRSIVHSNTKLPGSHKFQYLLGALSGEARDIVSGFEVCDDDYQKAWKALTDVYNDKPSMFMHIMNKFSSMEPIAREQPEQLRELVKLTGACLKSLESVGVEKKHVDSVITYWLIRKLPPETVAYWEETRDRTQLPTFESVEKCVETRIRVAAAIAAATAPSSMSSAVSGIENQHHHKQQQQSTKKKTSNTYHAAAKPAATSAAPAVTSKATGKKFKCPVCSGEGHPLRTCDKFLAMPASERRATIKKLNYCANCFAFNHLEAKCRSSHTCFTCGERHHSLLHVGTPVQRTVAHALVTPTTSIANANTCNIQRELISSSNILLATAMVTVLDVSGCPHSLRALIDQGSDTNFITESAATALQLPKSAVQVIINGIGATNGEAKFMTTLTLQSPHNQSFNITVETLIMNRITNLLPSSSFKPQRWNHLMDLTLADPSYHRTGHIDLVLGADVLAQAIMEGVRTGPIGTPIAQQTQFGWILSGKISSEKHRNITVTSLHATSNMETLMERFLAIESVEGANALSNEEQWCEQHFIETHERSEDGRFKVRLPFRFLFDAAAPALGRSRDIAIKRLLQLERRFAQNPNLQREYVKAINEHLETGRMQPTTSNEIESDGHVRSAYLPHHAVFKESSTSTKLRVVFDASRKTTSGTALNDILLVGPTVQQPIVNIFTNWRFVFAAWIADVQKMYLQVRVDDRDIEHQRIVWRNDPTEPIKDFALNRLTFGTSSAPFLAIRCVNQLAELHRAKYPEAADIITKDAYVDDVLSGGDDVQTAKRLQREVSEIMKNGGFELKKWASNINEVLEQIPESDREIQLPIELNSNETIKALGIAWHPASDSIGFNAKLDIVHPITKRTALSTAAKLFDPVGLIAPIVVIAKTFIKKLWALDLGWDEEIPPNLRNEWHQYIKGLQDISAIKIPRWIHSSKDNTLVELHGFCDASEMAYGAAVYLRTIDRHNVIHSHLISSKSKVAPKKALTIPRLELCGAQLLSKLVSSIRQGLRHVSIASENVHLWCDSQIVCYWLRSTKPLKVFVENRVAKIHEDTIGMHWRHVRTHENPADLVSRGVSPSELVDNHLWWHGPDWLRTTQENWPLNQMDIDKSALPKNADLEHRRIVHANICVTQTDTVSDFSKYNRLIRITSLARRFIFNCSHPSTRITGRLTTEELQSTRRIWILQAQRQNYYDEMLCLGKSVPAPLDHKSKLLSLTPFIDGNGLLRVRGRLEHSMLSYDEMHPIILPPNAHITHLLIDRIHLRTMHGGTSLVASMLRRQYWIPNARDAIRHRIKKCDICFRHRAATTKQLMGSLPSARVRRTSRPFLHTGIDYCGPFDVRASKGRGIKSYKCYIAVFICLTVKAIHLECVDGLTSDAFIAAFRRFVARRGLPSDMYSDNGTNFVGAANILDRQFYSARREIENQIADKFIEDNVKWHFIPPASPHFGGLWEAGVKSTKHHLRRVIGESKLTYEEMSTLLCQIEACLNSRPLCENSSDPNDLTALTPGHFLINSALLSVPEPSALDINPNRLDRWQQIQQMRQFFWKRWQSDYLSLLQQRPKWCRTETNLKLGELVLVQDDRYPSSRWPLGRIIEIHPGADGCIRVVTVKTASGVYKRNITRISRLPINDDINETHGEPAPATEEETEKSA